MVSDFIETDFKKPLSLLNRRHDVIAVPVRDRMEMAMPNIGLIELQDAETGELIMIDTSSSAFRSKYSDSSTRNFDGLKSMMRSINLDSIPIYTDKPYVQDLVQFFHMRHGRR